MNVLISGATKGIGLAILKKALEQKHRCFVVGRRLGPLLRSYPAKGFECDLSDLRQVEEIADRVKSENIDVLINNAGGGTPVTFEEISIDSLTSEINVNLLSAILLTKALLPHMLDCRFGRIVNISSISAKQGTPYLFSYSAAKAGLNSITQSLSRYLVGTGVTVNSICPGGVDTEMSVSGRSQIAKLSGMSSEGEYQEAMVKKIGIGSLIAPEEIAEVVNFLISEKTGYISGQSINVCGPLEVL